VKKLKGKWRFRIPLAVPVTMMTVLFFAMLIYMLTGMIAAQDIFVVEKYNSLRFNVDMICDEAEYYNAVEFETVVRAIEKIDAIPGIFAAVYDAEHDTKTARTPTYDSASVDPFMYPSLVEMINANKRGETTVVFSGVNVEPRTMHMYFRWCGDNLVIFGLSRFSVTIPIDPNLISWAFAFLMAISGCCVISVLSYLLERRGRHGRCD